MSRRRGAGGDNGDADAAIHSSFVNSLHSAASLRQVQRLGLDDSSDSLEADLAGLDLDSTGPVSGHKTSTVLEEGDEDSGEEKMDVEEALHRSAAAFGQEPLQEAAAAPRPPSPGGGRRSRMSLFGDKFPKAGANAADDDGDAAADVPPTMDRRTSSFGRTQDRLANARRLQKRASVRAFVQTGQSTRNLGLGGGPSSPLGGDLGSPDLPKTVAENTPSPASASARAAFRRASNEFDMAQAANNIPTSGGGGGGGTMGRRDSLQNNLANLKELFDMGHLDGPTYEFLMEDMKASHQSSSGGGGSSGGDNGAMEGGASDHTPDAPQDFDRGTSHGLNDDMVLEQYKIQAQRDATALVKRRLGYDPKTRRGDENSKRGSKGKIMGKDDSTGGQEGSGKIAATKTRLPKCREGRALPSPRPLGAPPASKLGRRMYVGSKVAPTAESSSSAGGDASASSLQSAEAGRAAMERKDSIHRQRTDGIIVLDSCPPSANGGGGLEMGGGGGGGAMSDALFAAELSSLLAAGKVKLDAGERVVRCMGCKSGLKVGRGAALVACPACGMVGPGTTEYGEDMGRSSRGESI